MNNYFYKALFIGIFITNFTFCQDTVKCNDKLFEDSLLEKIIGKWSVSGDVLGEKIVYNFNAKWLLNHQFIELSFEDTASNPQYMAKVFIGYDCISEKYVAHWLDNFGGRFSETLGFGIKTGNNIEFRFDYPEGPFLNNFIYDNKKNSWLLHSTTKNSKGIWVVFGNMYLKNRE
jgi:hypothetical protein